MDSAPPRHSPGHQAAPVTGLLPPIPTPFIDGRVDVASLIRLLEHLGDRVDGVLLGGSVGEVPSLTVPERTTLMRELASYGAGGKQLAVSVGDNSIEHTRVLAEAAAAAGAEVLLVACPGYFQNSVGALEEYFGAVSDFSPVDLCLYDNPVATHTTLSIETIVALAKAAPRLKGVKVTDTSLGKVAAIRSATDLAVYSGDDAVLWHQLCEGTEGAMVALPLIFPDESARLWALVQEGRDAEALEVFRSMATFNQIALGFPDYPAVIKAVLHGRGVIASPEVRLPLVALSEDRRRQALAVAPSAVGMEGAADVA